ncbi:exo-beta-N-acetylmuramidase NamZ domain-containing protein [Flavobacterium sp. FlaQc-48]|uniref:exo-beta-N-acetylmuramidase NamZ family protein n=1 Tax=Flavobacterium sp. FlaQc-48 TaxID=3374181 RepID=UPI003758442D
MIKFITKSIFIAISLCCAPSYSGCIQTLAKSNTTAITNPVIKTGADNYEKYLPLLKDKKVGIVTNQTGILTNKTHVVDFLLEKKVAVQTIFAPEHGFRGTADAGEHVVDGKDPKTGLPIISLYGDNKKPKAAQLAGIDVMIFDLQDVGARFYTYISSLHYVMEACAENNVPLIIFDRPNPNGRIVDGPLLEKEFSSFVGMHPIPLLHGMTIGEYAKMINGEKWLKDAVQCKLTVIPCVDYNRKMDYSLLAKPSPNLPNDQSINLYASLCLFEGTNVSMGRGTEKQFQIYGSPYLTKTNFSFTPKPNFGAKDPLYNGKECFGEDLTNYPKLNQLELKWLIKAYQNTSDKTKFFNAFFTKLAGTKKLQQQIESGVPEDQIRKSWQKDLETFKKMRLKYLIY